VKHNLPPLNLNNDIWKVIKECTPRTAPPVQDSWSKPIAPPPGGPSMAEMNAVSMGVGYIHYHTTEPQKKLNKTFFQVGLTTPKRA
jgi:hypothetical protein